jgi:hypothetical protein
LQAVSGSRLHLCDVMICPLLLKARSLGADDIGMAKTFLEKVR